MPYAHRAGRPRTEELEDAQRFDLVWLALAVRAPDAVEPALDRAWRELRPGGCALVASLDANGADLGSAVSRLRCAPRGGAARLSTSRSARCPAARA